MASQWHQVLIMTQHEKHTDFKRYGKWNVNKEGNFEWETHMHWAPKKGILILWKGGKLKD